MLQFFSRFSFIAALAVLMPAFAADPPAAQSYQKFIGETFVSDLDGQAVSVRVVYDGLVDSNIVTLYKSSKINTKDKMFLVHHDPAGAAGTPAVPGTAVMPPYAISLPKASADALMALTPGTAIDVVGTAHKSVFGMMSVKSISLYVEGASFAPAAP